MTIHLPHDLESSIQAAVHNGRFATVDDAMAEAARLLLREISQGQASNATIRWHGDRSGAMREAADELDEIVSRRHEAASGRTVAGNPR